MLISDLAPFGSFPVAMGPVIQHSTVPNTYAHWRPRQTPQAFAVLRTALWAAGTAARRRQRVQGIRREGNNPSHIGASNPPISEAASLSSEVTISTLRATCQGSALLADASSFTSKSTSMPVMRVRASSSDTASRRNRIFSLGASAGRRSCIRPLDQMNLRSPCVSPRLLTSIAPSNVPEADVLKLNPDQQLPSAAAHYPAQ
jgi:hypothetical protein